MMEAMSPSRAPPAAEPEPALVLHLHGGARLLRPDGPPLPLEGRSAALCALAALAPGMARETAAGLLWPDSDDPRRNLRQQLLRLRQQVGHDLVGSGTRLALAPGVALAEGDGELLPGHEDGDEGFAAWLADQRARHAAQRRARWQRALAAAEAAGELDRARQLAETAVAFEPASEAAWHALMRVHYLRGDPTPGLAAYEQLRQVLARRQAGEPSADTQALADALRLARRPAPSATPWAPVAGAVPATLQRPPRVVGRERELAVALAAWEQGRAVWLEGEAGLGKSRLMAELLHGPDTRALLGTGRPGDAGTPYATLARWLSPLLADAPQDPSPPLPDAQRQALAVLTLPRNDGGAATRPGAALAHGTLVAAVAAVLDRHAVACAALDDLHFADAATLELAAALASRDTSDRRWIFATRPAEAPAAASALRDGLLELHRLTEVSLAPLAEGDAAALVDSLALPGLAGPALAPALVRHTGGNPLYMLETLKLGLHDGSLAQGQLPRPDQVGALITRRLKRLSEGALTLARVAAIAGVDFSVALAEAVTGQRAVQLAGVWQELQDAHVLRDEAFAHDLVADAALRSVPPAVARRVHEQCAQWLAQRDVEPARVAWHWRRGGQPRQAGRAFLRAAERADQASRLAEEAELYAQAARCFAEAGDEADAFDARLRRVRALKGVDFDAVALQEAQHLVEASADDRQRMQALSELSSLHTERGESLAAMQAGQAALDAARRLGDTEWQVRSACHLTAGLIRLGRGQEAVAVLAPLKAWVEQQPDPGLRMLWFGDWGAALGDQGRLREAIAAYDTAVLAAREARTPNGEGQLLMNCAIALRRGGQFDRALAVARQGRLLCTPDADDPNAAAIGRLVVARDEAEAGLYASALGPLEAVLAEFEARDTGFWACAARTVLARLWLDLAQTARAVPLLREEPDHLPAWLQADRLLLRLDLAQQTGQLQPAGQLERVLDLAAQDDVRGPLLRVRALRHQAPDVVLDVLPGLQQALRAWERLGGLMGLHLHQVRAALALGRRELAGQAAGAIVALFDEGIAPDGVHRAEAWWVAFQGLRAAGHELAAASALRRGEQWLREVALPQVPAPFLDSFLHRQAINRDLLAAAAGAHPLA